jgi:hypothetical protein
MSSGDRPRLVLLPEFFREKATSLREDAAAEQPARAYERCAELLEAALRDSILEPLTLSEAEIESGYTKRHLLRLIRQEVIPATGDSSTGPVILRRDLPRKPGYAVAEGPGLTASSRVQLARAVAEGG